jgi:hypothetical protein
MSDLSCDETWQRGLEDLGKLASRGDADDEEEPEDENEEAEEEEALSEDDEMVHETTLQTLTRLQTFPTRDKIKAAVSKAMMAIGALSEKTIGENHLASEEQLYVTTAMVGIIFYNSFAGRREPWEDLTREHVADQIAAGANYVLCNAHLKTADTYGLVAKYVPTGSMEAMNIYMHLPGKKTSLFLEPTLNDQRVSVDYHLERFGHTFMDTLDPPSCNLIRMYYHSQLLNTSSGLQWLQSSSTNEEDVEFSKYMYEEFFGEPVEWPQNRADEVGHEHAEADDHETKKRKAETINACSKPKEKRKKH